MTNSTEVCVTDNQQMKVTTIGQQGPPGPPGPAGPPGSTVVTVTVSGVSTYNADLTKSFFRVDTSSGALQFILPNAHTPIANGVTINVKRIDGSLNPMTISEGNYLTFTGTGPDGSPITITDKNTNVTLKSDGVEWSIT